MFSVEDLSEAFYSFRIFWQWNILSADWVSCILHTPRNGLGFDPTQPGGCSGGSGFGLGDRTFHPTRWVWWWVGFWTRGPSGKYILLIWWGGHIYMGQMLVGSHVGSHVWSHLGRGIGREVDRMFGRERIWCFDMGQNDARIWSKLMLGYFSTKLI